MAVAGLGETNDAAEFYEAMLNTKYRILVENPKTKVKTWITLFFEKDQFYHLTGIQHIVGKNIPEVARETSKARLFDRFNPAHCDMETGLVPVSDGKGRTGKAKIIPHEYLKKSEKFPTEGKAYEARVHNIIGLDYLLEHDQLELHEWDKTKSPLHSKIDGEFLLTSLSSDKNAPCFLFIDIETGMGSEGQRKAKQKQFGHNDFCRSFVPYDIVKNNDYRAKQQKLDILYFEKITVNDRGEEEIGNCVYSNPKTFFDKKLIQQMAKMFGAVNVKNAGEVSKAAHVLIDEMERNHGKLITGLQAQKNRANAQKEEKKKIVSLANKMQSKMQKEMQKNQKFNPLSDDFIGHKDFGKKPNEEEKEKRRTIVMLLRQGKNAQEIANAVTARGIGME